MKIQQLNQPSLFTKESTDEDGEDENDNNNSDNLNEPADTFCYDSGKSKKVSQQCKH